MSDPLPQIPAQPGAPLLYSQDSWRWIRQSFQSIRDDLEILRRNQEKIMATNAELQASLDALTTADAENATRSSEEIAQLAAAVAAIPVGEPVTQAQLDQVNAVVSAMQARNAAFAADDAPTAPPATP